MRCSCMQSDLQKLIPPRKSLRLRLGTALKISLLTLIVLGCNLPSATINSQDGLALKGYDAVAYFSGEAKRGTPDLSAIFEEVLYHFSTNANLERFQESPEKFLPAYGGYCAYAMLEGDKVDINPMRFKVIQGKLYLFYDGWFGDTLRKWNQLLQEKSESSLIQEADHHWERLLEASRS